MDEWRNEAYVYMSKSQLEKISEVGYERIDLAFGVKEYVTQKADLSWISTLQRFDYRFEYVHISNGTHV